MQRVAMNRETVPIPASTPRDLAVRLPDLSGLLHGLLCMLCLTRPCFLFVIGWRCKWDHPHGYAFWGAACQTMLTSHSCKASTWMLAPDCEHKLVRSASSRFSPTAGWLSLQPSLDGWRHCCVGIAGAMYDVHASAEALLCGDCQPGTGHGGSADAICSSATEDLA